MLDCVCCLHFVVMFFTFHFFVLFTFIFVYNHGLWEQLSLLCISVHIPLSVRWLFPQRAQTNNRGRHYRWPIIVALTTQLSLFHQENTKDEHNKCINNNNNVTTSPFKTTTRETIPMKTTTRKRENKDKKDNEAVIFDKVALF